MKIRKIVQMYAGYFTCSKIILKNETKSEKKSMAG